MLQLRWISLPISIQVQGYQRESVVLTHLKTRTSSWRCLLARLKYCYLSLSCVKCVWQCIHVRVHSRLVWLILNQSGNLPSSIYSTIDHEMYVHILCCARLSTFSIRNCAEILRVCHPTYNTLQLCTCKPLRGWDVTVNAGSLIMMLAWMKSNILVKAQLLYIYIATRVQLGLLACLHAISVHMKLSSDMVSLQMMIHSSYRHWGTSEWVITR